MAQRQEKPAWRRRIETTGVGLAMVATLAFTFTGSIGLASDVKAGREEVAQLRTENDELHDDIDELKDDVGDLVDVRAEIRDLAKSRNDLLEAINRENDAAIERAARLAVNQALKRIGATE